MQPDASVVFTLWPARGTKLASSLLPSVGEVVARLVGCFPRSAAGLRTRLADSPAQSAVGALIPPAVRFPRSAVGHRTWPVATSPQSAAGLGIPPVASVLPQLLTQQSQDRLYWVSQKRVEKSSYLERVNAREIASIPLVTLASMALGIVLRDLTNSVNHDEDCAPRVPYLSAACGSVTPRNPTLADWTPMMRPGSPHHGIQVKLAHRWDRTVLLECGAKSSMLRRAETPPKCIFPPRQCAPRPPAAAARREASQGPAWPGHAAQHRRGRSLRDSLGRGSRDCRFGKVRGSSFLLSCSCHTMWLGRGAKSSMLRRAGPSPEYIFPSHKCTSLQDDPQQRAWRTARGVSQPSAGFLFGGAQIPRRCFVPLPRSRANVREGKAVPPNVRRHGPLQANADGISRRPHNTPSPGASMMKPMSWSPRSPPTPNGSASSQSRSSVHCGTRRAGSYARPAAPSQRKRYACPRTGWRDRREAPRPALPWDEAREQHEGIWPCRRSEGGEIVACHRLHPASTGQARGFPHAELQARA
jgi:hypothetical protein